MLHQHLGIEDMFIKYHILNLFVENTLLNDIFRQFYFPSLHEHVCMLKCLPAVTLSTLEAFPSMHTQNYKLAYWHLQGPLIYWATNSYGWLTIIMYHFFLMGNPYPHSSIFRTKMLLVVVTGI